MLEFKSNMFCFIFINFMQKKNVGSCQENIFMEALFETTPQNL